MKAINPGHFLLTCRLDNWVHLLEENHFHIARDRLPQALYISATALALAPAAAAESLIYRKRIRETKIEKDPIFILGHWRSGTTYLQNVLSRDEQFGWFDPVNTIGLPYSLLLGRLIQPPIEKGIQNGRPQDNVQYSLDLPMEETFGVLTISPYSIIHMIAFPENYKKYIEGAFVSDLPVEELRKWERSYDYAVRKLTYIKKGKQLILKSPDNTARIRELLQALGISRAVVDEGMRRLYRGLTAMGGHEAALLAAREVAASGKAHSLDNVAALLEAWNAKGLTTAEAIEAHLAQVRALNRRIRGLMDLCGHRGGCTQANRELLLTWQAQWGMPEELVDLAAEFARGVDKPMPYMNRLLEGWRKSGALTVEAARAEHERFQAAQKDAARPAAPAKRVIEQQYEQRTYDPDEFGDLSEEQLEELNRK